MRAPIVLGLLAMPLLTCVACGSSSSDAPSSQPADTGGSVDSGVDAPPGDAPFDGADATDATDATDAADAVADAIDGGGGSGTITGSVKGAPFDKVVSAYWIGVPDDPATIAVYVVGGAVSCADISASGWSHTIAKGTQIFEMIMAGSAAGSYKVTSALPAAGEAEVQYIFAQPTRNETRSNAGTITLATLTAKTNATGTFSVQFPDGTSKLDGSFDAVYCATGHEP